MSLPLALDRAAVSRGAAGQRGVHHPYRHPHVVVEVAQRPDDVRGGRREAEPGQVVAEVVDRDVGDLRRPGDRRQGQV